MPTITIRVDSSVYKELKKIQKWFRKNNGVNISLVEASKYLTDPEKYLKFKKGKKEEFVFPAY